MYAITRSVKKRHPANVKQLQAILHLLGQPISVDGLLGNNTKNAVKTFQKKQGLSADGVVGKGTWLTLYNSLNNFMTGLCDDSQSLDSRGCEAFKTESSPFININAHTENSATTTWLQALLHLIDNDTQVNGRFDETTQTKIKAIQKKQALNTNGEIDNPTWQAIFNEGSQTTDVIANLFLTDEYIQQKADEEGLEPAAIKAVIKVESGGAGFYSDTRPKILFEGHKFWQQLDKKGIDPRSLQAANEDILYRRWTTQHYTGKAAGEYDRLQRAKAINEDAALNSASWGMFQIMGFNSKSSGFDNVKDFVSSMSQGENRQLDAFFAFLHHEGIFKHLKNKDWANFARRYNGSQFKKNEYDSKLQVAFDAAGGAGTRGLGDSIEDTLVNEYSRQLEDAFAAFDKS